MAKCHHCGNRKFGLVQHRLITFQGILRFCTKKCKEDYQKKRQDVAMVAIVHDDEIRHLIADRIVDVSSFAAAA